MRTLHTDKYYTSMEHLLHVYDRQGRKLRFNAGNMSEYEAWKKTVRSKLIEITGIDRMEKCRLKPGVLETVQMDGYRRDKMIIQTEPDVWMPFYILIPDGLEDGEKRPCIIATHGHNSGGKYAPAGRRDIPAVKDRIEARNSDYGVRFVQRGYIVLCPDARSFGERREASGQTDDDIAFMNSTCTDLNHMAICMGQSVTGMWTWDLMRLIDYIDTREDCKAEGIGCCGLSGGGLQTLWLAALDDRVKCAVVSGYFYGNKDSLIKRAECACNYVPHLWEYVDMGDIGALIAPRALLIETGDQDPYNGERGLINVIEQVEIVNRAYTLVDAEEKLYHHIFAGEHMWNGEKTYAFVDMWL